MTAPFDYEGLWAKAKLFINRSGSALSRRAFDEAALWASLALELLGKGALAKVHPTLVADPSDDGKSLLIAAGISKDHRGFKSIPAKAVFSRCARAFPPFNAEEASRIAINRNEDLHSAALPFESLNEEAWWQRFWAQAVILIDAQDRSIEDFVGTARVDEVEAHLVKNSQSIANRVAGLLARAQQRIELVRESRLTANVAAELAAVRNYSPGMEYTGTQECPACGETGFLYGDFVADSEEWISEEEGWPYETLTIDTERFACDHCGLILDSPELVRAAELPEFFQEDRAIEIEWDDYGND